MPKTPEIKSLNLPSLLEAAKKLPNSGTLVNTPENYLYLDIDDNFIHELFPMLANESIKIPNYFEGKNSGAHLSVIYPEEKREINADDYGQEHSFSVLDVGVATLHDKDYYVLWVAAPTLQILRQEYFLNPQLFFKGYRIDFHITIAVSR